MSLNKIEIFSGTGGVGKTTLATSRALYLAKSGRKVLLITIDPAKRLKEILGLTDADAGLTKTIEKPFDEDCTLSVQLMSPHKTIERIAKDAGAPDVLNSRILKILTKPYGGLNEILALIELQLNLESLEYETIVLDTPPGSHFTDFLEGIDKIRTFFDQTFIDIFDYLDDSKKNRLKTGRKFMTMMISSGVKKLLDYLGKVTGAQFIKEFMRAISAIYSSKDTFLKALELQKDLKKPEFAAWYLVTAVDQNKISEAMDLKDSALEYFTSNAVLIINKGLSDQLNAWQCDEKSVENKLKMSLIYKENKVTDELKNTFSKTKEFSEIMALSPKDHVVELAKQWMNEKV